MRIRQTERIHYTVPFVQSTKPLFTYNMNKAILVGVILALIAAVCYGFIPYFTIPIKSGLSQDYMSDVSILFYRFGFAALLLGVVMLVQRKSFKINREEMVSLIYLAFISDGSALFLIDSYNYMSTGVATTLHFMYPVITAVLMMVFYHEARQASTIFAIFMAVAGVAVVSWSPDANLGLKGLIIVLTSAVCYALYLIRLNRSRAAKMESTKLVFYIMLFGAIIFGADALSQDAFQVVSTPLQLRNLGALALICTVTTNICLVYAIKRIGSTMTAVIGALEPLTAVIVGCVLMNEAFTWQILTGILLIIPAVMIIIWTRRH